MATRYQLYAQVTGGSVVFQRWYAADDICGVSICSVTPPAVLSGGTSHTFYVQTSNAVGMGPWSAGLIFTPFANGSLAAGIHK